MKMCEALGSYGMSVELVTSHSGGNKDIEMPVWDFYGIKPLFSFKKIGVLPSFKGKDYAVLAVFYAFFNKADMVYTRCVRIAMMTALLGINTFYEAHGPIQGKLSPFYYRIMLRCRKFRRLIVISESLKDYFYSISPKWFFDKIIVAPDAVDFEEFQVRVRKDVLRRELGLPVKGFLAGYVGHLYPGKGMATIFELGQRMKEQHFIIVGGKESDIKVWRERTKHLGNIELVGFVPNSKVKNYLAAFDVLLMPYQERVLGSSGDSDIAPWMSPMKMFEYMASKRPIIASDLPVLREILKHEDNSILVSPKDIAEWIKQIRRLKKDRKLGEYIAKNAFEDVNAKYTWDKRVQNIFSKLNFK